MPASALRRARSSKPSRTRCFSVPRLPLYRDSTRVPEWATALDHGQSTASPHCRPPTRYRRRCARSIRPKLLDPRATCAVPFQGIVLLLARASAPQTWRSPVHRHRGRSWSAIPTRIVHGLARIVPRILTPPQLVARRGVCAVRMKPTTAAGVLAGLNFGQPGLQPLETVMHAPSALQADGQRSGPTTFSRSASCGAREPLSEFLRASSVLKRLERKRLAQERVTYTIAQACPKL